MCLPGRFGRDCRSHTGMRSAHRLKVTGNCFLRTVSCGTGETLSQSVLGAKPKQSVDLPDALQSRLIHTTDVILQQKDAFMRATCVVRQMLSLGILASMALAVASGAETIDLSGASVATTPDGGRVVATAARMLSEEIAKRTGIELKAGTLAGEQHDPVIALFPIEQTPRHLQEFVKTMGVPEQAEGFSIAIRRDGNVPTIVLAGRDERGVLFAAGRLLLTLRMGAGQLQVPDDLRIATAPRYPHRGHQIGYRSLAHCYDAWTPADYEQYMRELAVFGANAFETMDFSSGPHAKVSNEEMAAGWARICADYGFDFWLFTEAIGGEGKSAEEEQRTLESRLEVIRRLPDLDHVYLTGGDGGTSHARPDLMFEWTGRFADEARKINPDLGVWVSNQGFGPERNNWFFSYLQQHQPEWVTGVVYGAWNRILADEQRARTPEHYPIRRYCDIGHCLRAQYPVPGWDRAFAQTLGREPFAPRPKGHARIHNLFDEYADGFVTYSDGIGDDVNKFVWNALGWDPDQDLNDVLLDYSRFFFGWDIGEEVRDGLFMLEENFSGSLAANEGVEDTYTHWKALEEKADSTLLKNWRFQSCIMRAYYDHYTRLRLIRANEIEARAVAALGRASDAGVEQAIKQARSILAESDQDVTTDALRARIVELGEELFHSIGAQLDVDTYQARSAERGAVLDFLDTPLNNKMWIEDELDAILTGRFTATMPESEQSGDVRLARLNKVIHWEDPGPGGFYDDLGCSWKQPHLLKPRPQWDDPAGVTTPREAHSRADTPGPERLSWLDQSEALNAAPLMMHYEGLDPNASYCVRVTYIGRYRATIRLEADDKYEIHGAYGHTVQGVRYAAGYRDGAADIAAEADSPPPVVTPLEFPIPREATRDGVLDLKWQRLTGRGAQVAEVWLIKEPGHSR